MSLKVFQIPVLTDNYIYLLREEGEGGKTAVVDPALASPVQSFLDKRGWELDFILNTHHHWDHTGGNLELKTRWRCPVVGWASDGHRLPGMDFPLREAGEVFQMGKSKSRVLFLPGHTSGHIAYWFFEEGKLFCGDTLFAMGCGRLFEGTPEQMFNSLSQIKALPPETTIYCAHEYTEQNGRFALTVAPHNPDLKLRMKQVRLQRKENKPTVPFTLKEELKTNPFLQAETSKEFASLRGRKDVF